MVSSPSGLSNLVMPVEPVEPGFQKELRDVMSGIVARRAAFLGGLARTPAFRSPVSRLCAGDGENQLRWLGRLIASACFVCHCRGGLDIETLLDA